MRTLSMMCAVGVVELLFLFALLGWGSLAVRGLRVGDTHNRDPFYAAWMGAALLALVLQSANFLWPIRWWISGPLIGIGLLLAARSCHGFKGISKHPFATALVAILALLLVFKVSILPPWNYDSGLYHINAVRMITEYPAVPGIAHFHDRFGFNNASLLFPSLLTFHPFVPFGWACATPAFGLLVLLELAARAAGILIQGSRLGRGISVMLIPPVCWFLFAAFVSAPAPDHFVFFAAIPFFLRLADMLALDATGIASRECGKFLIVAGSLLVTAKLSTMVFAAACLAVALVVTRRRPGFGAGLWRALVLAGMLGVTWVARGYLLTGFPAFPVPFGRLNLPWSLALDNAILHSKWVQSHAMNPHKHWEQVLGNWRWIDGWLQRVAEDPFFILSLGLAASGFFLALSAALLRWRESKGGGGWRFPVLLLPSVTGVIFWFFTAPDPRFLGCTVWLFAAVCWASVLLCLGRAWLRILAVFIFITPIAPRIASDFFVADTIPMGEIAQPPEPPLAIRYTADGYPVWVPLYGEQCWDSDVPATPYLRPGVHLLGPRLENGVGGSAVFP